MTILRDGQQDGFVREFGHPVFVHVVEDPDYGAIFNAAMSSYAKSLTPMVLEALETDNFSTATHVCDIGGGHGHLLCSLLKQYPALRGTVYDVASVVAATGRLWAHKMGVGERCVYIAGDMFQEVPAADAYLLKHITTGATRNVCRFSATYTELLRRMRECLWLNLLSRDPTRHISQSCLIST